MWHLGNQEIGVINHPYVFFALVFTTLSFLAVVGRVVARARVSRDFGCDDWCIVGALISHIITQGFHLYQIALGLGDADIILPALYENPEIIVQFLGVLYGGLVTYQIAQVLVKVSIIYQYRRLFTDWTAQKRTFLLLVWMVIYGSASVLLSILHCWPISNFWSATMRTGCASLTAVSEFLTISNVVNNFMVWGFPLFYIIPLKIPRRKKINLLILFASALIPEAFGIGRLVSLVSFVQLDISEQLVSRDAVILNLMGSLEVSTAIIIASIPALMPVFRHAVQRGRSLGRAPPNLPNHNTQRTPTRGPSFAHHLEGLQSGDSILLELDELLRRPTPTRARAANTSIRSETSPAPPRTANSQHSDTVMDSPWSFTPELPMTSFIPSAPPRLELNMDSSSFISDSLQGLEVRVDKSSAVDVNRIGDLDPKDQRLGSTTTVTVGEATD